MWMSIYVKAVKRALRDQHNIKSTGGTDDEPLFDNLPDGNYPMVIEGKLDRVKVIDGKFSLCNFEETSSPVIDTTFTDAYRELANGIRAHRDERGDNRCWQDDETLYKLLPEGYTPPERTEAVELENCQRYIPTRRNPKTTYVSPQVRIDELEGELKAANETIEELRRGWREQLRRIPGQD